MGLKGDINKKLFSRQDAAGVESINDIREKEFSGKPLTAEEKFALANFDTYRLRILNGQADEEEFHKHYRQLQAISNLGDWREFLKDTYSK